MPVSPRPAAAPPDARPAEATRTRLLEAASAMLREEGFAALTTRSVARRAGVPVSQIHYHFGSKQGLVLGLLEYQNELLLARQRQMYDADLPLWRQWEIACDYFDEDIASGYVAINLEMMAAGWSNPEIAAEVDRLNAPWWALVTEVAGRVESRFGGFGPFTADQVASLVGAAFVGAGVVRHLKGTALAQRQVCAALRRFGGLIRAIEEENNKGG